MRKHLAMLVALLLVVAVAVPAFAAVDFKYGGQFRVRYVSNDNIDGTEEGISDNQNFVDQRLRLYFTFAASENLKVVWKLEIGDVTWGHSGGRLGAGSGGNVGADAVNVETKNAYVDFNIPNTMVSAVVGIQGINLMNSWIIDDDFAAAVLKAKLDPVKLQLGYVAGQNIKSRADADFAVIDGIRWTDRIDSWFLSADYKEGPIGASLVGYYQFGHDTVASVDPTIMITPFTNAVPFGSGTIDEDHSINQGGFLAENFDVDHGFVKDNNLFDLGINLEYKLSWMSAYVSFVKNLGSVDVVDSDNDEKRSHDYEGFMVDGGANFFCGPYTLNVGGFYTTGDERRVEDGEVEFKDHDGGINRFVYPMATAKYFSEILGGGILDNITTITHTDENGKRDFQWTGYQMPSNIWTVTVGGAWQVLEKTKLSASYWYFGTSEDVETHHDGNGNDRLANDIGHELDFYITQGIVDGLTLDLVGAYLITGDAYTAAEHKADVYELGARLQWNF